MAWRDESINRAFEDAIESPAARVDSLLVKAPQGWGESERIPDIVKLMGEAKARDALTKLLRVPRLEFVPPEGSATERVARELADSMHETLPTPHWALVQRPGAAKLFERMEAKFLAPAAAIGPTAKQGNAAASDFMSSSLSEARVAYIITLLKEGRDVSQPLQHRFYEDALI